MRENRKKEVIIQNYKIDFKGILNNIASDYNPYVGIVLEKLKENNLSSTFLYDTEIQHIGNTLKLVFNYTVKVSSPNKTEIVAIHNYANYSCVTVYVKTDNEIYKDTIEKDDLELDYFFSKNIKILKNKKDELEFIDSMGINFLERYLRALKSLFILYYNEDYSLVTLKKFLKLDNVKLYILQEDAESISDTLPREELYSMLKQAEKEGVLLNYAK